MAIYHLSTNVHSRGKGHSAVAAAAYRSGEKLYDQRLGENYNWQTYRKSHGEVLASEIFLPAGADEKYQNRATLWNGAESAEKTKAGEYKKTAAIAREIEASLPAEMDNKQREELARNHAVFLVERYGAAVDMNIHAPHPQGSEKNHHVHFLLTTRELGKDGFENKTELELDGKTKKKLGFSTGQNQIKEMRENWAKDLNAEMERGGHSERVDHRSYEEQGINKEPSKHMGAAATDMERKGKQTERGDENREIESWNRELEELRWQESIIDAAIEKEKQRMRLEQSQQREAQKQEWIKDQQQQRELSKNYKSFADELDKQQAIDGEHQKAKDRLEYLYGKRNRQIEELEKQTIEAKTKSLDQVKNVSPEFDKTSPSNDNSQQEQGRPIEHETPAPKYNMGGKIGYAVDKQRFNREHVAEKIIEPEPENKTLEQGENIKPEFEKSVSSNDNQDKEKRQDRGKDFGGFER
ncbi:MAG: MobA/MobL family protein [Methyloprofundus sp.]|nr:MobA/MobL family protein [Methyloprofundus sp.]